MVQVHLGPPALTPRGDRMLAHPFRQNGGDDTNCKAESRLNWKGSVASGGVAQLGEHLPCTQKAIGSNPFTSTINLL